MSARLTKLPMLMPKLDRPRIVPWLKRWVSSARVENPDRADDRGRCAVDNCRVDPFPVHKHSMRTKGPRPGRRDVSVIEKLVDREPDGDSVGIVGRRGDHHPGLDDPLLVRRRETQAVGIDGLGGHSSLPQHRRRNRRLSAGQLKDHCENHEVFAVLRSSDVSHAHSSVRSDPADTAEMSNPGGAVRLTQ